MRHRPRLSVFPFRAAASSPLQFETAAPNLVNKSKPPPRFGRVAAASHVAPAPRKLPDRAPQFGPGTEFRDSFIAESRFRALPTRSFSGRHQQVCISALIRTATRSRNWYKDSETFQRDRALSKSRIGPGNIESFSTMVLATSTSASSRMNFACTFSSFFLLAHLPLVPH